MHIAKNIDNQGSSHTGASAKKFRKSSWFACNESQCYGFQTGKKSLAYNKKTLDCK